jgi:hypothetical protein
MPVGAVLREPESLDSRSASNEFSHRSTPRVNCSSGSPGRMTGPPSTTSQRVTRDRVSRATRSSQSSTAYSSRPYRSETANWSPTHGSPRRSSAISCACGRHRSQPLRSQRDRSSACSESPQPGPHGSRKGPVDGTLLCRALDREGRLDRDGGTAVTAIEFGQSRRRCVLLSTPGTRPSARALLRPRTAGRVDGLQDTRPSLLVLLREHPKEKSRPGGCRGDEAEARIQRAPQGSRSTDWRLQEAPRRPRGSRLKRLRPRCWAGRGTRECVVSLRGSGQRIENSFHQGQELLARVVVS